MQQAKVSRVQDAMLAAGSFLHPSTRTPLKQLLTVSSVTNAANTAGGSASNYGNGIKDATGASGSRSQTAQNPLGVSSGKYGGKKVVTGAGSKGSSGATKGTASNPLGLS